MKVTHKISWRYRSILLLAITLSWLTGVLYFILDHWVVIEGEFGLEKHPLQGVVLKIHGAGAICMMIIYGFLLGTHIPFGLKSKRNRISGITLFSTFSFLIVTSYFLYYSSLEGLRQCMYWIHTASGFLFPLFLILHILDLKRVGK